MKTFSRNERIRAITSLLDEIKNPSNILDVGGTAHTYRVLKQKFPSSKVTVLNISLEDTNEIGYKLKADASRIPIKKNQTDLILAGEILEHLDDPDNFIKSCYDILIDNGYMLLTTPNLGAWFNILHLLQGYTPPLCSPSPHYKFGYKAHKKLQKEPPGNDHKRVFTLKGLEALLKKYRLDIVKMRGTAYDEDKRKFKTLRRYINKTLPLHLRENFVVLCQKGGKK